MVLRLAVRLAAFATGDMTVVPAAVQRRWFRPLDGAIVLLLLIAVALIGIFLSPAILLTRTIWQYRARVRQSNCPRSLLILGYNTYGEAMAKGVMADPNLWYNCGEKFERVFVYIAIAEKTSRRKLSDRIEYRQDGAILPELQIPLAWTLLALRFIRGWWHARWLALWSDVMLINGPNGADRVRAQAHNGYSNACFYRGILGASPASTGLPIGTLALGFVALVSTRLQAFRWILRIS